MNSRANLEVTLFRLLGTKCLTHVLHVWNQSPLLTPGHGITQVMNKVVGGLNGFPERGSDIYHKKGEQRERSPVRRQNFAR